MMASAAGSLLGTVTGYDGVTTKQSEIKIIPEKSKYALYPVWLLNMRKKDKVSYAAINGENGKMAVDLPMDFRKYLMAKLALWTWDGTNKTVPEVLGIALPGSTQTDNGDGTVSISGAMMTERVYPVPAGIRTILRSP